MADSETPPSAYQEVDAKPKKHATRIKPPKTTSDAASGPQIPPPPVHKKESTTCKPDPTPPWKILLETTGLATLIIYTIFTGLMYYANKEAADAAKNSADVAREALEATQRAFISFSVHLTPVGIVPQQKMDRIPIAWQFQVPLVNSGNTPTRNLRTFVRAVSLEHEITSEYDFGDFKNGWRMFVGPKDSPVSETNTIPIADISKSWKGAQHIYIYGWATYNDTLPKTPLHTTKFCYELNVGGNPESKAIPYTFYRITSFHNCADEECDAQK